MRAIDHAFGKALALSLLLHAFLLAACAWLFQPAHRAAAVPEAPLEVTLRPRELSSAALQPPLFLDETAPPAVQAPVRMRPPPKPSPPVGNAEHAPRPAFSVESGPFLAGEAAREANAQIARELYYPPEAIARGLEGEVLVLLFLDASGNVIAARLEASSGHALLDNAAVRAARALRALPASAPREAVLPVRFRLR